jgi:hypothetical protein
MVVANFKSLSGVPEGTPYTEVFQMLENRIMVLEEYILMDIAMREKNPALQDLYEQYQTMRALGLEK